MLLMIHGSCYSGKNSHMKNEKVNFNKFHFTGFFFAARDKNWILNQEVFDGDQLHFSASWQQQSSQKIFFCQVLHDVVQALCDCVCKIEPPPQMFFFFARPPTYFQIKVTWNWWEECFWKRLCKLCFVIMPSLFFSTLSCAEKRDWMWENPFVPHLHFQPFFLFLKDWNLMTRDQF